MLTRRRRHRAALATPALGPTARLFATVLGLALIAADARAEEPLFIPNWVAETSAELERDFDLDADEPDRVVGAEVMLRLGLTLLPGRDVSGYMELEAPIQREWEEDERPETERILRLNQAFLRLRAPSLDAEARVGRWLFRDAREWLIDENLDGVRLTFAPDNWAVELLAGRVNALQRDLLDRGTRGDRVWELAALAEREVADDLVVGGYAFAQIEDQDERDRPLHLGLRARGLTFPDTALAGLGFWADAGVVRGRADGRTLRGWGFDVGVVHSFDDLPARPRLQLGYAFGSGGDGPDGPDRAFRQTGLHSNEAERGSIAKYKYYGEALDPELSNLGVLTVGAGASFGENVTLDLVYHRYRKHRARGELRDIALSADPDLPFRAVGEGLDLVLGLRPARNVEVEAAIGLFRPGRAFVERDRALFGRVEVKFRF